ncbi:Hypothetical predicted protein, partial [Prunus dulcis]
RRLESWAPQHKKKDGPSKPRTKPPWQAEGPSVVKVTAADRRGEKRVAEAEAIREAKGDCGEVHSRRKPWPKDEPELPLDPLSLSEWITEKMVESYKGKDANADSSSETDSSSEEDEAVPTPSAANADVTNLPEA